MRTQRAQPAPPLRLRCAHARVRVSRRVSTAALSVQIRALGTLDEACTRFWIAEVRPGLYAVLPVPQYPKVPLITLSTLSASDMKHLEALSTVGTREYQSTFSTISCR